MKRIMLILFIFSCQSNPTFPWYTGNLDELKNITGSKLIMMEFYTDTWGWCVRLEADTFLDDDFLKITDKFNSIKINAGDKDGREIAEKYNVRVFPTVIFIDMDGNEIDRTIGYATPDEFIPIVNDILSGKNTILALEKELNENPSNYELIYKIGDKYLEKGDAEVAKNYFNQFLENTPKSMEDKIITATFKLAKSDWQNSDITGLQNFINKFPNAKECLTAYQMIARYYTTQNDTISEINMLQKITEVFPDNASAMNGYAWRMTELNQNLDDALIVAKKGVKLADEEMKPMILDTQAEIEWLLGDTVNAISTIKLAINMDPENDYYQSQLERFEK